jgi:hypothetical protein
MKQKPKLAILACLALILLVGAAGATINQFNFLVEDSSGNPLSGAIITLYAPGYSVYSHITGSDGKPSSPFSGYSIASPCTARITITKGGYTTYDSTDGFMEKTSSPGNTYTYYYPLTEAPPIPTATVSFYIKDSSGTMLSGAHVEFKDNTNTVVASGTSSSGSGVVMVEFNPIPPSYSITVSKTGYTPYTHSYSSAPIDGQSYVINLGTVPPASATVLFNIKDSGGTYLPGAWVEIKDNTNAVVASGTSSSGAGGFYCYFSPIPPSYSITVSKTGYTSYTHSYSSAPTDGQSYVINLGTASSGYDVEYTYGTATASTTGTGTSTDQAFDHITSTSGWSSLVGTAFPHWLKMDYGSGVTHTIAKYKITSFTTYTYSPSTWTFSGSNDDSSWVDLDSRSGQTFSNSETKTFSFQNSVAYRYYRILITANDGAASYQTVITELNLFNTIPQTPTPTPTPFNPSTTALKAIVKNSLTNEIISGATVSIPLASPTSSTSGSDGKTGVFTVPTSGFDVSITASGYQDYSTTDSIGYSATTQEYSYWIIPVAAPTPTPVPYADVSYTVREADSNSIIGGATVTIRDNTNTILATGTTSPASGTFMIEFNPIPSSYSIEVSKSGYETYTYTYTSAPTDRSTVSIFLNVQQIILNADIKSSTTGYLIQGADVGIYDLTHNVWRNSTAASGLIYFDSTGANYEYPLFVNENVTIYAWAADFYPLTVDVKIPYSGYIVPLNLVPITSAPDNGTYTIVFTVVSNTDQKPIPDVTITSGLGVIKLTNAAGAATFTSVPVGGNKYFVFSATGYQGSSVYVNGAEGQVIMRSVELVVAGATPTPTPTPTRTMAIGGSSNTTDLNSRGQTFAMNWADLAISSGGLIFLMGVVWFMKKIGKT